MTCSRSVSGQVGVTCLWVPLHLGPGPSVEPEPCPTPTCGRSHLGTPHSHTEPPDQISPSPGTLARGEWRLLEQKGNFCFQWRTLFSLAIDAILKAGCILFFLLALPVAETVVLHNSIALPWKS